MSENMPMEIYKDQILTSLSYQIANGNIYTYYQSDTTNGVKEERIPWQDGWNACARKLTQSAIIITQYLAEFPENIIKLIIDDKLRVKVRGDVCNLYVDSSDLFSWGYLHNDDVEIEDLPDLIRAYEESPKHGGILWVCRKEKMRPQKPYYKYFNEKEIELFNACGLEKEIENDQ